VPMLSNEPETPVNANYVNTPAVRTGYNGLLFLIYPGRTLGFVVNDGTSIQCQTELGHSIVTVQSRAYRIGLQVLADDPAEIIRNDAFVKFSPEDGMSTIQFRANSDFRDGRLSWFT
jgi:hypothetical protein